MIVLGIDPGTHRCGYGVVEKTGPGLKLLSYGIFDTLENDEVTVRERDNMKQQRIKINELEKFFLAKNMI